MLKLILKLLSKMIPKPAELNNAEAWRELENKKARFHMGRNVL